EDIDVPPTLVSFAIATHDAKKIITPEFKSAGDKVYLFIPKYTQDKLPNFDSLRALFEYIHSLAETGEVKAIYTLDNGGVAEGLAKMSFGNRIGFKGDMLDSRVLFGLNYGGFIVETAGDADGSDKFDCRLIGQTVESESLTLGEATVTIDELQSAWESTLEGI